MTEQTIHAVKANFQGSVAVRRETHQGTEHLVVPVVMICEGVLNDALLTAEEFGIFAESWNGRPVPVLHPERNGTPVSANQPDIIERNTVGVLFNTHIEDRKLKAEAWINIDKANALGHGDLIALLEAGEVIEVSTGYFAEDEEKSGTYNGKEYTVIHRNIRPDHLALLPGEIGACSVEDGCGTRTNSRKGLAMKTKDAIETLAKALGLRANCKCQEQEAHAMTDVKKRADEVKAQVEKLKTNEKLSAEQVDMLMAMDEEQLALMGAFVEAIAKTGASPEQPAEMEDEDDEEKAAVPAQMSEKDIDAKVEKLLAKKLDTHLRRANVTQKLTANKQNIFSEEELAAMSIESLEKLEKALRPADYSGQGGFAANSDAIDKDVKPLTINRGVLTP